MKAAFTREQNDKRLLRKADKNISTNIEDRINAYLQSGLARVALKDEVTGTLYQVTIIDGEVVKREI